MAKKKIILVGGARPNFVKVAALLRILDRAKGFSVTLVHTGQHYDYELSASFFHDLEIRRPDYFLDAGSGTHASQTAKVMVGFEKVCISLRPDLVVVVGDVNSTLACTVVAKKLMIKVAHIEAGLRSRDLSMPEEINRIVTDSISDYLFITEPDARSNLKREGHSPKKIFFAGNTMIDTLKFGISKLGKIKKSKFSIYDLKNKLPRYGVVTLHRPANVDTRTRLKKITHVLNKISRITPLIFPIHPRTRKNLKNFSLKLSPRVFVVRPLGYLEFLFLYKDSFFVLTDSGGIQEETTFLGVPCFTLRRNTERPVTINRGTNVLIGDDFDLLLSHITAKKFNPPRCRIKYWDGKSSLRIERVLRKSL